MLAARFAHYIGTPLELLHRRYHFRKVYGRLQIGPLDDPRRRCIPSGNAHTADTRGETLPIASLSSLDYTIIGGYFAVVLFIGLWVARRTHTGEDLFLAGRRLGWLPIGFSLFASNISSTTLIGLSGAAYAWGIAVSNYEWMAAFILVFFAIFFIPYYLSSRITTVPEYLERRFDRRSRLYFSGLTLISNIAVDTAGTLFAGAIVLQQFFPGVDMFSAALLLAALAGVMAGALLPGLDNPDLVFPTLVSTLLPAGLSGLVFAGLLAALMSSIDSTLNSASALLTMDFMQPDRRGWSARRTAWVGRGCIVLFMLLAAAISPLISEFTGLFHYLQSALAYLVPPVVVIFLFGLFWRRTSASGAFATLLGGHAISALLFALSALGLLTLHFTIVAGLLGAVSAVILITTSLASPPPTDEQVRQFTFHAAQAAPAQGLRWWQDYRLHCVILLILVTAQLLAHW